MHVLNAYPTIRDAVAWYEYIMCVPEGESSSHDLLPSMVDKQGLDWCLTQCKEILDEEVEENDGRIGLEKLQAIRKQVDLPAFRTYFAGKFGMV